MTDKKLKYINHLQLELHDAKCKLAAWAGEGRAWDNSVYTAVAMFLRDDKDLLAELDNRITSYFKEKVDNLQKAYDAI